MTKNLEGGSHIHIPLRFFEITGLFRDQQHKKTCYKPYTTGKKLRSDIDSGGLFLNEYIRKVSCYFQKLLVSIVDKHVKESENCVLFSFAHLRPLASILSLGRKTVKFA